MRQLDASLDEGALTAKLLSKGLPTDGQRVQKLERLLAAIGHHKPNNVSNI